MAKRSDFVKRDKDQYLTPLKPVLPLIPFLPKQTRFYEPCAGDGRLVKHLLTSEPTLVCTGASELAPEDYDVKQYPYITQKDALELTAEDVRGADYIITNPPWSRDKKSGYLLHNMIQVFTSLKPTWLLFDSDWMHTKTSVPYQDLLVGVVAVGRVKWIEDSPHSGKDNCQWHLFHPRARDITPAPMFFGQGVSPTKEIIHG